MELSEQNRFYYHYQVELSDIDSFGHVNNARYIQLCEAAAWQHSEHFGVELASLQLAQLAVVVHEASYRYLMPSYDGDRLTIETWIDSVTALRMKRYFLIKVENDPSRLVLEGSWNLVVVNMDSGSPARLKSKLKALYQSAEVIVDK